MTVITGAGPSREVSSVKVEPSESSSSASILLRNLKSAQNSHSERIATAKQALLDAKVPRVAKLARQWILDEWMTPVKNTTSPSIVQKEYHELFRILNQQSGAASPPFAILSRCLSELEKHRTPVGDAPVGSLTIMIASHTQTTTYGRWVEMWTGVIAWLAASGVLDGSPDSEIHGVEDLSDAVFQHVAESTDIIQAESSSIAILIKAIPSLSELHSHRPHLADHLTVAYAEILRSFPSDSLDQFLVPALSSHHASIAQYLPLLLRSLAATRSRSRYSIFSQPTSSKVAYETHIAQSLHEALYRDFSQAMAYLDGVALLGEVDGKVVWEARFRCWDELRKLDVRIEGVERWALLVTEAARGARVVLNSGDEGSMKICLRLLACLSVLDFTAAGISDTAVQQCLQPQYISSTEGTDLLITLLHHHRLIRAPVAYIELLCRCLTTPTENDIILTNTSIPSSLLTAIHDLITHSGDSLACWRTFVSTSKSLLSSPTSAHLSTFSQLLSALILRGCPDEIKSSLEDTWILGMDDISMKAKGKKGKSKLDLGQERLSAILIVRSALRAGAGEEVLMGLTSVIFDRSALEELDLAICRFLLSTPTESLKNSTFTDSLIARLPSSTSYWSLLGMRVLKRIENLASDSHLQSLAKAIISQTSSSRYIWTSSSFWELPRLSSALLGLITTSDAGKSSIGFAVPSNLQTTHLATSYIERAGQVDCPLEMVKLWLEQVNVDILLTLPSELLLKIMLDADRRDLCKIIINRCLQSSPPKVPEVAVSLSKGIRDYLQTIKPTLSICAPIMDIVSLFVGRKSASIPPNCQEDLSAIAAASSKALGKSIKKSEGGKVEIQGRIWLDLQAYTAWSGDKTKLAAFPDTLLGSLISTPPSIDPSLPLRLVAAKGSKPETLIAIYIFLRSQSDPKVIDEAMSTIIQTCSSEVYASFWQCTVLGGGDFLPLLIATDREGSGKVVRGHLGPALASVQRLDGSPEVLVSLWRHRAILFDEGQAIDSWSIFSGIFLAKPTPTIASSVLDAATSFTQQRAELIPGTSTAITTSICSILTYLRGSTDVSIAEKIARFLDTFGRTASTTGPKRKHNSNDETSRQNLTRSMARHVPVILIAYARAATDPMRSITATTRRVIDPSLAELCMSTDAATGKAFDSTGIPYGLGEGLAGEAESAVWAQIWRSWKKKRYTGQG